MSNKELFLKQELENFMKYINVPVCGGDYKVKYTPIELGNKPITPWHGVKDKKQEGKTQMYYIDDFAAPAPTTKSSTKAASAAVTINAPVDTTVADQRRYLKDRLFTMKDNKRWELKKAFGYNSPSAPRNYKELLDAVKNGEFSLDEKRTKQIDVWVADGDFFGSVFDGIVWTKFPGFDRKGYDAVTELLDVEFQKARDIIEILPVADGLAALNAFEAFVPAGAPTTTTVQ